jgi:hypothetical protein
VDDLRLIYTENAKVAAIFWEWRHKTLTLFFTGMAGVAVAAAWTLHNHPGRLVAVPLGVGAGLAVVAFGLNRRSHYILGECYRIGGAIEDALLPRNASDLLGGAAIFKALQSGRAFGWLIGALFALAALGQVGLAVAALVVRPHI